MFKPRCAGRLKKLRAAFWCYLKDYHKAARASWKRQHREELIYASPDGDDSKSIIVWRDEIPELLDDEFFVSAFEAWHGFKLYGSLPFSGGYREQPCQWCDAVRLFEGIYNEHLEQERH